MDNEIQLPDATVRRLRDLEKQRQRIVRRIWEQKQTIKEITGASNGAEIVLDKGVIVPPSDTHNNQ